MFRFKDHCGERRGRDGILPVFFGRANCRRANVRCLHRDTEGKEEMTFWGACELGAGFALGGFLMMMVICALISVGAFIHELTRKSEF